MARACGSYPQCQRFNSVRRYHNYFALLHKEQSKKIWPHGQAVKTSPFHGGIPGSSPGGVTIRWAHSSVGRAPALQAGGHRFEPYCAHNQNLIVQQTIICGLVVQLVRMPACHAGGRGFESLPGRQFSKLKQNICWRSSVGRATDL